MQNTNLKSRPRRLRKNQVLRELVQETILTPAQFVAPIFIHEGSEHESFCPLPYGPTGRALRSNHALFRLVGNPHLAL